MKKLFKKLHLPIVLMLILSILLSGCVMSLTCISHIDRDRNGECDNCGIAMEIPREDIEKIEVTTLPTKTYYGRNETLDVTGGKITVTYNDGKPDEEIDMTAEGVTIVAPGMGVDGKKSVQVKYGGYSATFVIEVGSARFTVSFDLGYEGGEMESQFVTQNTLMEEPAAPEREGYSFLGWFTDEACTQRFDFALTPVTADMTLYADALSIVSNRMDQIPSKDSMPGSLYSDLAKIYEKAVQLPDGGSITIIAVTTLNDGDITHAIPDNTGYITEGQLYLRADPDSGKVIIDPFRSLSRLKQLVIGKQTREDHNQVMNTAVRLYSDAQNAKTKLENGFDLSDYDLRCLDFAKEYATRLLAIDVNISIDEMLDTAWELFGKYFTKAETGIRQSLIDKYWQ